MMKNESPVLARKPVSVDILEFAQRLADKADVMATKIHAKLNPVMQQTSPSEEKVKQGVEMPVYPPFFDELRTRFNVIDRSLEAIQDALLRTEL